MISGKYIRYFFILFVLAILCHTAIFLNWKKLTKFNIKKEIFEKSTKSCGKLTEIEKQKKNR